MTPIYICVFAKMCGGRVCLLHILLIFLALTKDCVGSQELKSPALEFNKHVKVQPIVHHGRTKRHISTTRDSNGVHHSEVQVTVPIDGEPWVLDLRLNEELVTAGHTLQYQERGNTVQLTPKREELDLCHYSGSVRGRPRSWVAASTCHGLRGVIFDGEKMRYIEPAQGPEILSSHYIYDRSDLNTEQQCSHRSGVTNNNKNNNNTRYDPELARKQRAQRDIRNSRVSRRKRDRTPQVHEPYNANKLSRYVELVLVADHRKFQASGHNIRRLHSEMIAIANIMNSIYSPLNIFIALVGVEIWSEKDKIQLPSFSGDSILKNFLLYRRRVLNYNITHDNAHLLTKQEFEGSVVGKGNVAAMCTAKSSGGVAYEYSTVAGLMAGTIAHEMGHNFGMQHDDNDCECPGDACVMSAYSSSKTPAYWSDCSLKYLTMFYAQGGDFCLRNKPKSLFKSTCGNGFIEPGEQCDCGNTADGGISPCHACCHPDTCMLRVNATCGAGACCDLTTCQPLSAGAVCRAAERECDLPEYCTGNSEYCPEDVYKMDSTPCGGLHNQAYCVRGVCRSHSDQCRLLWGPTGVSQPKCYHFNTKGNVYGNCGYAADQYKPCAVEDAICGRLHCSRLDEKPKYGFDHTVSSSSHTITENGRTTICHAVAVDMGVNDPDLGLVPDGAKCGHEEVLTALSFYATGSYQRPTGDISTHSMAQQTVSSVLAEVTKCIDSPDMRRKYIHFPQNLEERNKVRARFYQKFKVPGVLGCIDCTHIALIRPTDNEERYYCRKHYHSLNVQLMCLNQRCVSVAAVRAKMKAREFSVCPSDCSGHGVCNSEGHCHCDAGFAPPLCVSPGPGGATDSGPAADPKVQKIIMITLYVIFLGIVPFIAILLLLIYYFRHKHQKTSHFRCWKNNFYFTDKMSRLQNSASSLRHLITFKRKRNNLDPACGTQEPIFESIETVSKYCDTEPNLNNNAKSIKSAQLEFKKPLIKRNNIRTEKEDIQIVTNVNLDSIDVKPMVKMSEPHTHIVNKDLQPIRTQTLLVKNCSKTKPMAKINKADIQIANNNITISTIKVETDNQIAINMNLKPVKTNENVQTNQMKLEINTVKLKPVNKKANSGVKVKHTPVKLTKGVELASEVKLRPVNLDKINKAKQIAPEVKPLLGGTKPAVSLKPVRPREKPPVMIVKQGLASTSNVTVNKGHLYR